MHHLSIVIVLMLRSLLLEGAILDVFPEKLDVWLQARQLGVVGPHV